MPGKSSAEEMPRLDAFDQEFGREPVAILRGHRRRIRLRTWVLIFVALGAGVISALAVSWPNGDGLLRFELQSAAPLFQRSASREDSDEQIDRLRREVDALKKEISDLTEAHRQAGETIAGLASHRAGTPSASAGGVLVFEPGGTEFRDREPITAARCRANAAATAGDGASGAARTGAPR